MESTMASRFRFTHTTLAAAALIAAGAGHAQTTTLNAVVVSGKAEVPVSIGGWGDVPLSKSPFQASVIGSEQMRDQGVQRLADIVRLDPAVSDAYNAVGYWDFLTVRGYVLDNRANYRRDAMPINAETSIPLDNKESIELLKGTSGLQAGTSAPGGLVNFVVKRPTPQALRSAQLGWQQDGSLLGGVDISQRFGQGEAFGVRVNAAAEHLDPRVRNARGERHLMAVAADWRLSPDTLFEAEVESSHRSQPSVPGFSLLGTTVPAPSDPRINLNNQPWSLPVVFDATTASLRVSQRLSADWRFTAHAATQRLRTDDRIAFPFGCFPTYTDRYCSDGTFDLYDFRSDNERRRTDALELALHGSLQTGSLRHDVSAGALRSRFTGRFEGQAFNFVGTGNVQGTLITPPDPTLFPTASDRDERSTELFARDAVRIDGATTAWLGLRHTRLSRSSADGTGYRQNLTTPWLALSREFAPDQVVYASWGEGVETAVTPNLPAVYGSAANQPLPALKSRQIELGIKGRSEQTAWNVAVFDIDRPATSDEETNPGQRVFFIDGSAHHRGIEANGSWQGGPWTLAGAVQFLHARREGSHDAAVNGKRPNNVPDATLKLQARHDLAAVRGLSLQADVLAESHRILLLPEGEARIAGYGRLDAGARYLQPSAFGTLTWRAGIDNLLDRRAWKDAPFQFGHAYLFPMAPRTLRLSVEAAL
jgi:iron complex outermembrane receptor protein